MANQEEKYRNMKQKYNYTTGVNGQFNFYVISVDTRNQPHQHGSYGKDYFDLDLSQAQEIYRKCVLFNPEYVNTVLGVAYLTDKTELDINGKGAVDLLQCVSGKIQLLEDYKQSAVLSTEGLIAVNTISILKNSIPDLQSELDKQKEQDKSESLKEADNSSLLSRLSNYENFRKKSAEQEMDL